MTMRVLYFDLGMGAAGDMLTAALLELLSPEEQDAFVEKLNTIGIPEVRVSREVVQKSGITGSQMHVHIHGMEEGEHDYDHDHHHSYDHGHHHTSMAEIGEIIDNLAVEEEVKKDVLAVYEMIAEAESHAHGVPVTEIHFHEVGMMDAIADITGVCLLIHMLEPDRIVASPIHVGSGHVHCAHGIMPVPAPATAYILRGVPIYGGSVRGELCTPTGAALVRYFTDAFEEMPLMTVDKIGYGMGKKEFAQMNCVRAMIGESRSGEAVRSGELNSAGDAEHDEIIELVCNIDDMTGEEIGFAVEQLLSFGAREVFTVAAHMKKSRPGILLHVITDEEKKDETVRNMFALTTTIGIRVTRAERFILERREENVETDLGKVRRKICRGYGVERYKWEYDDVADLARRNNMSVREVRSLLDAREDED